jgi:hypothetical protein
MATKHDESCAIAPNLGNKTQNLHRFPLSSAAVLTKYLKKSAIVKMAARLHTDRVRGTKHQAIVFWAS